MIVKDQKSATFVAASALTLGLIFALTGVASADTPLPAGTSPTSSATTQDAAPAAALDAASAAPAARPMTITLVAAGRQRPYVTSAKTVGAFLDEHAVRVAPGDYLSSSTDTTLSDGMSVVYHPVVPIVLYEGKRKRIVRSSAETVADLLREQGVAPGSTDEVSPVQSSRLLPNDVVHVDHIRTWTARRDERIVPPVAQRLDTSLASGDERTLRPGSPGEREVTLQFVRRNSQAAERTVLASRIIREPSPKIVVRGIAAYASLARVAEHGFSSALHFAGSALHVIATAYTSGCYGCNGLTASGVRAGFGVIAVDPRVIPLGTRLFVPGYGRAIAGDTGGAIVGRRVDLGFDTVAEALRFGRQPMTVYVLK